MARPEITLRANENGQFFDTRRNSRWEPVYAWEKGADGKSKQTDQQIKDPATGQRLWALTVIADRVRFGRTEAEFVVLEQWADSEPGAPTPGESGMDIDALAVRGL